jgi:hypothetical protein
VVFGSHSPAQFFDSLLAGSKSELAYNYKENIMENIVDQPEQSFNPVVSGSNPIEMSESKKMSIDIVETQKRYIGRMGVSDNVGVVFQEAFIKGMRDLGYKSPGWAFGEIIDNAYQSTANLVEIRFQTQTERGKNKPKQIAVIDNGVGMIPEMISYAVRWGGTGWHESDSAEERQRIGSGRFGYGLPSAAVSMAKRYTVYSKVTGGEWNKVTVDLEDLASNANDIEATTKSLESTSCELPQWLLEKSENGLTVSELESGTIVVLEDLDKLNKTRGWILFNAVKSKLRNHLSIIYRHWLSNYNLIIDGEPCQPVDPLFLMSYARHYDENEYMAESVKTVGCFDVTNSTGEVGQVRIRAAVLPPEFGRKDPLKKATKHNQNGRWGILKNNEMNTHGLNICREGRQIDTVQPTWTKFQNNDLYIKVEVDFDPVLDEFMGVTTSKQQIVIDEDMWNKLIDVGKLKALIDRLRLQYDSLNNEAEATIKTTEDDKSKTLPSGEVIKKAVTVVKKKKNQPDKQKKIAQKNLEEKIIEEMGKTGKDRHEVEKDYQHYQNHREWDREYKAIEEGPFFQPKYVGEQKVITINTAHPFYEKVYKSGGDQQTIWEVFLFVLAEGELNSDGPRLDWYKNERIHWSQILTRALNELVSDDVIHDKRNVENEVKEVAADESALEKTT